MSRDIIKQCRDICDDYLDKAGTPEQATEVYADLQDKLDQLRLEVERKSGAKLSIY